MSCLVAPLDSALCLFTVPVGAPPRDPKLSRSKTRPQHSPGRREIKNANARRQEELEQYMRGRAAKGGGQTLDYETESLQKQVIPGRRRSDDLESVQSERTRIRSPRRLSDLPPRKMLDVPAAVEEDVEEKVSAFDLTPLTSKGHNRNASSMSFIRITEWLRGSKLRVTWASYATVGMVEGGVTAAKKKVGGTFRTHVSRKKRLEGRADKLYATFES
ncbi:hypothetical protein SAICODRAFT_71957 [Saitoella complicata NRRL Y-17804]|uniref:uncharacterized protein n=1 Tax=Saitoella complicata (strain BCRC 22490 / CBS 7301 / JCM 7358 / NBRC 10748 / NRRL Y-17804) TaxID=698492 RepID=UPI000866A47C|nr:uncharacterized protein SAICODRAFT_71957 [Saitoella complicata NRRL Y-17804]ODQ52407.1 hypothetical protein SAICODRAFT_71957 [Saitoella complicata NRRL Y-17804]